MTDRSPRLLLTMRAAHGTMFLGALGLLVIASPLMGEPIWPYMLFAGTILVLSSVSYWLIRRNDQEESPTSSPDAA
ncbi:hypothetical protein DFP74_2434 [Nocardiopsis sp. Huas11]|uniref:hypothetical protein n=1 Tax=Nocardiopsis sp. Huas11 TaxID=2183912 RepID=UPI000EAEAA38|nr:hypothetical protein [Nocardiopsis sp. Huas11]RKS06789.1 hypothetical protein DFP74_2434 [Nocardiopsis sp. Huas11]